MFTSISRQNQIVGGEENLLDIQVSVCYILKHLEGRKALSVHTYYTWCDIILIFKLHRRTRLTPRSSTESSTHSLKIRMTSHPCNKYDYNISLQCTYDKTLLPSHVQKTIYHSFDVTTMFKK